MWRKENPCALLVGWQTGTNRWGFLKKLKIDIPYSPAIPLLGIYPKDTKTVSSKAIITSLFIAALFVIAKVLK